MITYIISTCQYLFSCLNQLYILKVFLHKHQFKFCSPVFFKHFHFSSLIAKYFYSFTLFSSPSPISRRTKTRIIYHSSPPPLPPFVVVVCAVLLLFYCRRTVWPSDGHPWIDDNIPPCRIPSHVLTTAISFVACHSKHNFSSLLRPGLMCPWEYTAPLQLAYILLLFGQQVEFFFSSKTRLSMCNDLSMMWPYTIVLFLKPSCMGITCKIYFVIFFFFTAYIV